MQQLMILIFLFIVTVSNSQTVSSFVGGTQGFADGNGNTARFRNPWGIAVDANGNLYVADAANNRIRKITPAGSVTTLAGGNIGFADGTGADALFRYPTGVAVDNIGNVFVADMQNNAIRKITQNGTVTTIAGGTFGNTDGIGNLAQFNAPYGIAIDNNGILYIADRENSRIRKITNESIVTTLAGSTIGFADGTGTQAQFWNPFAVAVDAFGNIIVGETHRIRKITSAGEVTTLAGSLNGGIGTTNGIASGALFNTPTGFALSPTGEFYIADRGNHRIRKIDVNEIVSTFAGSTNGFGNGIGTAAQFYYPNGIVLAPDGNFYVTDAANDCVRKIAVQLNNNEYNELDSISLYPNPITDQIHLELNNLDANKFIVYDINGREIQSENIYKKITIINVSSYLQGIYFIKIISEKGFFFRKIMKQ